MKIPEFLKAGDLVAIVCPASFVSDGVTDALELLTGWGLRVLQGETLQAKHHQFAGDDQLRIKDFQAALDNPEVKAIFAARGGYGTVRIIDHLDFSGFAQNPKWLVGFSDITVLHSHIQSKYGIPTIHGQMPFTLPDATRISLETLRALLFDLSPVQYQYPSGDRSRQGTGQGILIGGNLAVLCSVAGSESDPDFRGKILFLEDVGEYYYAVDRMLWMLKRAGKLAELSGLIIGGFTAMKDGSVPFGSSIEEIVMEKVSEYRYPVAFDFPAGHIENNQALCFGAKVSLSVDENRVTLSYLKK